MTSKRAPHYAAMKREYRGIKITLETDASGRWVCLFRLNPTVPTCHTYHGQTCSVRAYDRARRRIDQALRAAA